MAESNRPPELIQFACGHTRKFSLPYPEVGSDIWCLKCQRETIVVTDSNELYRIYCTKRDYTALFGTDKHAALRAAQRHITRKRHPVSLWKGGTQLAVYNVDEYPIDEVIRTNKIARRDQQQALKIFINSLSKDAVRRDNEH